MLAWTVISRRRYGVALLCLHLAASTGCYRWAPVEQASTPAGPIRVRLRNGGSVDGQIVRATSDSLVVEQAGRARRSVIAVPTSEVEGIERRAFSATRSAAYGAALAVGVFAAVAGILNLAQSRSHHVY
jgi:hypothetical protein